MIEDRVVRNINGKWYKSVSNMLYTLLVLCICFEEIFVKMLFGLTSIKYVISLMIILLIMSCVKTKARIKIPNSIKLFYGLLIIAFFFSLPDFIELGWGGFLLWKQYVWLPVFIFVFSNTNKLTTFRAHHVVSLFVRLMILYCILNSLLYFIDLPIWKDYHVYMGRITVGYPTVDVVVITFALLIVLFHPETHLKYMEKALYATIFIISILSQASGTGIFLLAMCLVVDGFYLLQTKRIRNTSLVFAFGIISLFAVNILSFMKSSHIDLYDKIMLQIENRVYVMMGKGNQAEMDVNTMDIREIEFQRAEKHHGTLNSFIFGNGFGKTTGRVNEVTNNIFLLEDQYHMIRFTMGWLGVTLFYFIVLSIFYHIFFSKIEISYKYLYCSSILSLIASTFTAFSLGTVGICGSLAIILSDSSHFYKQSKKIKCFTR